MSRPNLSQALANVTVPARIQTQAQQCSGAMSVSRPRPSVDGG
ncbi:hypothetical protein AB0M57_04830 [Streptomyces sp. NPDC051597]